MTPRRKPKKACAFSCATPSRWSSIAKRLTCPSRRRATARPAEGQQPAPAPRGNGDGEVSLVIMLDLETEVEMKLPGRFKVSPQIAGAIKAVSGVVDVQTL